MTLAEAESAVRTVGAALAPIDVKQLAVRLDRTMALWRTPDSGDVMEFYLEALEEFPPEVIEKALKHVRMTHRYPTMPSPADFRAAAEAAAVPLRGILVRARLAAQRLRDVEQREARYQKLRVVDTARRAPVPMPAIKRVPSDGKREIDLGDVNGNLERWSAHAGEGEV